MTTAVSKKEWLLAVIFLFVIAFYTFNSISDSDVWYHLKTGEYIWETKTVPTHDIFSYTAEGARWVTHELLSALIFFLVYHLFNSIWSVMILAAIFCFLTYWLVLKNAFLRGANFYLALILIFPVAFLTLGLWVPQPKIFSYFLMALLLFLLEKWRRDKKNIVLYSLPFIFLIWANLHSSVILGLVILAFYLISEKVFSRPLFFVFVASLVLCFVNPNTYRTLTYFLTISPVIKFLGVMDWKSILSYLYIPQAIIFLILMVMMAGFIFWSSIANKKFNWRDLGLVAVFFILPLISIRHFSYFPLVVFPIFVRQLSEYTPTEKFLSKNSAKKLAYQILIVIAAICLIIKLFIFPGQAVNKHFLPVAAANFIEQNHINGPMFNLEMGGYLIWRLWPQQKVFLDGRSEVFAGQPADNYKKIALTQDNWLELVKNYNINYFVLAYKTPLVSLARNLTKGLREQLDFRLVYWDDASVIYLKNSETNGSILERFEYKVIQPFYNPNSIQKEDFKMVAQEIMRALEMNPDSNLLMEYGKILSQRVKVK
jgi:hypothetical protein